MSDAPQSGAQSVALAMAQMNPIVGDLAGNLQRIQKFYETARARGADLVIFPELALVGYPPEDLVLMHGFRDRALLSLQELAGRTVHGPAMIVGTIWEDKGSVYNAAVLLDEGKIRHVQLKSVLPNYGVFDEKRVFSAGAGLGVVEWRGLRLAILVCEDVWETEAVAALAKQKPEMAVVINASPFEADKMAQRKGVVSAAVQKLKVPLVYVNMVGGQDELVFDGGSFAVGGDGMMKQRSRDFEEALDMVMVTKTPRGLQTEQGVEAPTYSPDEALWHALVLGLHDYVGKNGFPGVVLGLSGGIDSAVTAAVAVDALGKDAVKGVLLPSPYSSQESVEDALETAKLLGIETFTIPISEGMKTFEQSLGPAFGSAGWMDDVLVGGNLQARLRAVTLMAMSNKFGWMLMSTGNKSEIAVGYSTLYGDSCGGYNVLKDVYKTQVYALAYWRNRQGAAIPQRSITKAPSAELAPGQKDEDQLPPYETLDAILLRHIEERMSAEDIVADGYDLPTVTRVLKMVRMSEYKRRQGCPGVKVSSMLFGRERRYPLTNKF
ncbi:MAG: NAD+ synthase [Rickettsiales bacterium]|nr:NAD+ synthase [Rickettsiales bacterium]